jgi:hypothetical protein
VRHQRQVAGQRDGGDEVVVRANGEAARFEIDADTAINIGCAAVERQTDEGTSEGVDRRPLP